MNLYLQTNRHVIIYELLRHLEEHFDILTGWTGPILIRKSNVLMVQSGKSQLHLTCFRDWLSAYHSAHNGDDKSDPCSSQKVSSYYIIYSIIFHVVMLVEILHVSDGEIYSGAELTS